MSIKISLANPKGAFSAGKQRHNKKKSKKQSRQLTMTGQTFWGNDGQGKITSWPGGTGSYGGSNGSGSYGSGGSGSYVGKSCSHPPTPVVIGDIKIYAAARRVLVRRQLEAFDIVSPLVTGSGDDYEGYTGMLLWFPIRDYTAPDPQRLKVHCERLIAFARAGMRILTFCEGSHGRTGTVLATLVAMLEPDVDPIHTIRARHCSHAVETAEQRRVIFDAVGRPVPEEWLPPKTITHYHDAFPNHNTRDAVIAALAQGSIHRPQLTDEEIRNLGTSTHTKPAENGGGSHFEVVSVPRGSVLPGGRDTNEEYPFEGWPVDEDDIIEVSPAAKEAIACIDGSPADPTVVASIPGLPDIDVPPTGELHGVAHGFPFPAGWSRESRYFYRGATNTRNEEGYLICPVCLNLIEDPNDGIMTKTRLQVVGPGSKLTISGRRFRWAHHKNCRVEGTPLLDDLAFANYKPGEDDKVVEDKRNE